MAALSNHLRIHDQSIAFYEKLILLDGGTIALSLTFISSMKSNLHLSKAAVFGLVAPSWALLLISVFCSWQFMLRMGIVNQSLVKQVNALAEGFHLQYLSILTGKIPNVVKGTFEFEGKAVDVAEHMTKASQQVSELATKQSNSIQGLVDAAGVQVKQIRVYSVLAMLSTQLALILMCVFAVKSLLTGQ